jgi:hypothetical protein
MVINIVKRMVATFIATAIGVVGSGAIVGVDVAKAALMAGVGAVAVVLERLSRAFLEDGELSESEINAAFGGFGSDEEEPVADTFVVEEAPVAATAKKK